MDRTAAARRVAAGIFGLASLVALGCAAWWVAFLDDVDGPGSDFATGVVLIAIAGFLVAAIAAAGVAIGVWRGKGLPSLIVGIVAASFLVLTGFGSTRGEGGNVLVGLAVGVPALVALVALAIAAAGQADEAAAAARGPVAASLPPPSPPPRPTWGQ